jgi:hypothetical protein
MPARLAGESAATTLATTSLPLPTHRTPSSISVQPLMEMLSAASTTRAMTTASWATTRISAVLLTGDGEWSIDKEESIGCEAKDVPCRTTTDRR